MVNRNRKMTQGCALGDVGTPLEVKAVNMDVGKPAVELWWIFHATEFARMCIWDTTMVNHHYMDGTLARNIQLSPLARLAKKSNFCLAFRLSSHQCEVWETSNPCPEIAQQDAQ